MIITIELLSQKLIKGKNLLINFIYLLLISDIEDNIDTKAKEKISEEE